MDDYNSPAPVEPQRTAPTKTSKRRKRSELSPSSKATHSIIEKERREAMNEKFSELAANIPELVEAIASGKRPTKGEIVKASIARHQDQERRVRELMHEIEMLRAGGCGGGNGGSHGQNGFAASALETSSPLATVSPEPLMPATQTFSLPYQIQTSHPIGLPTAAAQGNLWVGQLLNKTTTHEPLSFDAPQPLSLLPDLNQQPVSPFKQTSMMNWNLSSLPQPLDPASLSIGFAPSGLLKGFMDSGSLDHHHSRRGSGASGPTPTSGFSSPTFTSSSDSDSTFSTDALDTSLDERRFLAESMAFEPFAMPSTTTVDQTPLTSLVGLPATSEVAPANTKARRPIAGSRRARKDDSAQPAAVSLAANT